MGQLRTVDVAHSDQHSRQCRAARGRGQRACSERSTQGRQEVPQDTGGEVPTRLQTTRLTKQQGRSVPQRKAQKLFQSTRKGSHPASACAHVCGELSHKVLRYLDKVASGWRD